MHGISNRDPQLYSQHNSSVRLTKITEVGRSGWITDAISSGWRTLRDSVLSRPTSERIFLEWPWQEQRGSVLTASAQVSEVSVPACTNKLWPIPQIVGVAQQNRLLAMLFLIVLHLLFTVLPHGAHGLTLRVTMQSNGCSTSASRCRAALQWIRTRSNEEEVDTYISLDKHFLYV